jgi:hypothetical protein
VRDPERTILRLDTWLTERLTPEALNSISPFCDAARPARQIKYSHSKRGRRNIRACPRLHITDRSKARRTPSECRAIRRACFQRM